MANNRTKSQDKVHSIRFDDETYLLLALAAKQEGLPFAKYVKGAAVAYAQSTLQEEEALHAIDPQNPDAAKQTLFEVMKQIRADIGKATEVKDSELSRKVDKLDELLRLMLYVVLYYSREIPAENRASAQLSAKTRMEQLLKGIDRVPVK